ncbi:MAG: hypothetical protein L6420_11820 [Elusimicrobia bacterium]|nr:hypothetical protein [Elusimicrobiota bacterium]
MKYLTIGGIAVILYGVPRATFDLDILIEAKLDNAQRLLDALLDAGFATASLTTADDVLANEITIFKDKVRIDVQTSTPGITFHDAWNKKNTMKYHGQIFFIVSKDDLLSSKRASGRDIDIEDARLLNLPDKKDNTTDL